MDGENKGCIYPSLGFVGQARQKDRGRGVWVAQVMIPGVLGLSTTSGSLLSGDPASPSNTLLMLSLSLTLSL